MKRMRSLFSSLSVILLVVFITIFSACNTGGDSDVSVTGVTLNKSETSLLVGATETLTATVLPDNATNQGVSWSSSDSAVATVSVEGVVTAVAAGTAIITVTTDDGDFTAGCETVVNAGSSDPPGDPVVYVAGYYLDSTGGDHEVAAYWKDGVLQADLHNVIGQDAKAQSVFAVNDDVYVAGYYYNGSYERACYWKNGVKTDLLLPAGAKTSMAYSITVSSGVVYVSGYYTDNGDTNNACYWKDDSGSVTRVDLQNAATAKARDIFVSGGNVYTSGYYHDGLYLTPCYWTNTSRTDLPKGATVHGYGESIYLSGSVIYIGGSQNNNTCYWIDSGTPSRTDLETSLVSQGYGMDFSGSDLFIAGVISDSGLKASYWRDNGVVSRSDLPQETGTESWAFDVSINNSVVYVVGYDTIGGVKKAVYWTESTVSEKTILNSTSKSEAISIFIAE